jgi:hypothetical protein
VTGKWWRHQHLGSQRWPMAWRRYRIAEEEIIESESSSWHRKKTKHLVTLAMAAAKPAAASVNQ